MPKPGRFLLGLEVEIPAERELHVISLAPLRLLSQRMAGVWDYGDADDIQPLTDSSGNQAEYRGLHL